MLGRFTSAKFRGIESLFRSELLAKFPFNQHFVPISTETLTQERKNTAAIPAHGPAPSDLKKSADGFVPKRLWRQPPMRTVKGPQRQTDSTVRDLHREIKMYKITDIEQPGYSIT